MTMFIIKTYHIHYTDSTGIQALFSDRSHPALIKSKNTKVPCQVVKHLQEWSKGCDDQIFYTRARQVPEAHV